MIFKDNTKQVVSIYEQKYGKITWSLVRIYKGASLFWEAIRSCFGRGFWVNERQWSNEDGWKNNQ